MMVLAASDMRGAKVNKTKENMRSMSTCLVSNKTKVNMCVWAHACLHGTILAVKEGRGVPGEGEGESLTVGNAQKM